jgi:glycosyltransferase involved in cell wall biosynthesis
MPEIAVAHSGLSRGFDYAISRRYDPVANAIAAGLRLFFIARSQQNQGVSRTPRASGMVPVLWYLVFANHTILHSSYMVRPLALTLPCASYPHWPAGAESSGDMKVLLFVRDLAVGGSQRQLAILAAGLARRGHDVAVVVLYAGGALEALLADSGSRLLSIEKVSRWDVIAPLARLRRLFVSERPDLIYAFLPTQTTLAALLLPARLETKLVFGLRAGGMQLDRYDALNGLTYRTEAWLSRRADLIIANARAVRADAAGRGLPAERIAVVPNGIDTDAMRPDAAAGRALRRAWGLSDDAFVIGCVARLDPMKDHANFLDAAARFARDHHDAHFVCVGDGPAAYRDGLKARANSLGLGDRMAWAGEVGDVRSAYNAFDIATLTSAFGEGFPNVIGEAMACGIPVVATDVGDARPIVGEFGEVVPPKNPALLCAGWERLHQRLVQEPGLRQAARRSMVASYGLDAMVRRTEDILTRLAADRRAEELAREFA